MRPLSLVAVWLNYKLCLVVLEKELLMNEEDDYFLKDDNGNTLAFKNDKLFINGKEVVVKEKIELRWFELILLVATALGTFASGAIAILSYFCPR